MHTNFNTYQEDLVKLLSLNDSFTITKVEYHKDNLFISIIKDRTEEVCPVCGCFTNTVHDYYVRTVNHGVFNNYNLYLLYRQRRYKCDCGKSFNEKDSIVEKYHKISINNKLAIFKEARSKSSFKDSAARLNISSTTFIRHFSTHCVQPTRSLPKVLSIDEFKGNSGGSKYLVSIADPINKVLIDILPNRFSNNLEYYFKQFSLEDRLKVEFFTTDMWAPYKTIANNLFPNALVVADAFHYSRHVHNAFNNTRIRIMKKFHKSSKKYKFLKKYWKLLIKRSDDLSYKTYWNNIYKYYYSQVTIVDFCRNIHPELNKAYELKETFYKILDSASFDSSSKLLINWIINCRASFITEFNDASSTIENWLPEIVNSFIINPVTGKRYSNAYIEGTNNYIKAFKRISFGIPNFNHFRNKILYQHKNSNRVVIGYS